MLSKSAPLDFEERGRRLGMVSNQDDQIGRRKEVASPSFLGKKWVSRKRILGIIIDEQFCSGEQMDEIPLRESARRGLVAR